MRSIIGATLVLALAGFTTAAVGQEKDKDKIDGKLLIGKWEPAELGGALMILEFTDKGKLSLSVEKGGKSTKVEGTYKLDADARKLEMTLKLDGKEQRETITVSKLTDDEFVGKDAKGKEEKLKKVKAKN